MRSHLARHLRENSHLQWYVMASREAPSFASNKLRPSSKPATAYALGIFILKPIRGCHAMRAENAGPSSSATVATCFRIQSRSISATIRNGSIPWCSMGANCGARTSIRRLRCRSTPSNRILSLSRMSDINRTAAQQAAQAVPGMPRDAEGPVFREPWEAQAFAMALALYGRGVFTWPEWAAALAAEIKRAQSAGDPDTGETYYSHWLNALERLVAEKGVAKQDTLHR